MRVAGLAGAALAAGARRVRAVEAAVPVVVLELPLVAVVAFFVPPDRAAFAFSTILESMLVAVAERELPVCFKGEPGRLG